MKIVKISICLLALSLISLLHFPLLYCNDPTFCHFPVTSYPRNQIAFRIRRLLSRPDYLFHDLIHFANNFLVADAVLIMYIVAMIIRKNIGNIVRILIVSILLLYAVYKYDQYTRKNGPIPIKEIPALLKAFWKEISSQFWEFMKTKEEN